MVSPINLFRSSRGLTVIEALIGVAILSIVTMAILTLDMRMNKQLRDTSGLNQLDVFRRGLAANVAEESAWLKTVQLNSALQTCLGGGVCPGQYVGFNNARTFILYDGAGQVYYDPTNPNMGVDVSGRTCTTFNLTSGNPSCPYRFDLRWYALASAVKPIVAVFATLMQARGPQIASMLLPSADLNRFSVGICTGSYVVSGTDIRCNAITNPLLRVTR